MVTDKDGNRFIWSDLFDGEEDKPVLMQTAQVDREIPKNLEEQANLLNKVDGPALSPEKVLYDEIKSEIKNPN